MSGPHLPRYLATLAVLALLLAPNGELEAGVVIREGEYEGRAQFVVEAGGATWYYDRAGGGFSRLIDRDGRDWIGFRKEPLSQYPQSAAAGYRGLGNLVFGKGNPDAGAGHPGFDRCESQLVAPDTIRTRSLSGRWAWTWTFSDAGARMRMEQVDPDHSWWFLYEGTIGGRWAPASHRWGTDAGGPHTDLPDNRHKTFGQWRWVDLADQESPRALLLAQDPPDKLPDTLWFMGASDAGSTEARDGMVVFGFGRENAPQFRGAGLEFLVAFHELGAPGAIDHDAIARHAEQLLDTGHRATRDRLREYEQFALTHDGSSERGRTLFLDEQRTKCGTCHVIAGRGGAVGPDLSQIGGKFDRPHLIESLLEPSRQIVEGYRASVVVTTDGRVATGIVKQPTPDVLHVMDVNGKTQIVPVAVVDVRQDSPVSLMPERLHDALSLEEFTDLVAFLESLRPEGKVSPGAGIAGRITLPQGFEVRTVVTGLDGLTALETTADGRIFVCEQTGRLRVIRQGRLLEEPFVTLPVDSTWERGLIGVTVDPGFPDVPYVYVCYVAREPYPHHRVSRFTAAGDVAEPGSELVLLEGDDQATLGGKVPAGHQGGAIHFGPDGRLYVAIGEQTAETPSQDLGTFQGKLLRIGPDGSIPSDNPFAGTTSGKYRAIWALGLRNPFTFAFRNSDGLLLINDVGGKFEEINVGVRGANYGWPVVDHGPLNTPPFQQALHHYPQASISGGDFFDGDGHAWPDDYRGRYFFADFVHGWIKTLDPDEPQQVETFASGLRRPVDLRFAADGGLYVLLRNAWVIDAKFQPGTGSVVRIGLHALPANAAN